MPAIESLREITTTTLKEEGITEIMESPGIGDVVFDITTDGYEYLMVYDDAHTLTVFFNPDDPLCSWGEITRLGTWDIINVDAELEPMAKYIQKIGNGLLDLDI